MSKINAVFIPGLLNDDRLWQSVIESLIDIVTPYYGNITKEGNMSELAKSVLNNAPEKFILIGLSMGGYVSLEIMRQAPERVLGLALFDTNARADIPESIANRHKAMGKAEADFNGVIDDFLPKIILPASMGNSEIVQKIHSMAQEVGIDGFKLQQTAIIKREDQRENLKNIQCPTLIACGKEDKLTPVNVHEEMHELISNSTLEIIENCAHLTALECPSEVSKILRNWISTNFLSHLTESDNIENINSIGSHKNNYNMQIHEYGNSTNLEINNTYNAVKEDAKEEN